MCEPPFWGFLHMNFIMTQLTMGSAYPHHHGHHPHLCSPPSLVSKYCHHYQHHHLCSKSSIRVSASSLLHAQHLDHPPIINSGTNIILMTLGWWAHPISPNLPIHHLHHRYHFAITSSTMDATPSTPNCPTPATINPLSYLMWPWTLHYVAFHCWSDSLCTTWSTRHQCHKFTKLPSRFHPTIYLHNLHLMTTNAAVRLPATSPKSFNHPLVENQRITAQLSSMDGYKMHKMLSIDFKSGLDRFWQRSGFCGWVGVLRIDHGWSVWAEIIVQPIFLHILHDLNQLIYLLLVSRFLSTTAIFIGSHEAEDFQTNKLFATCTSLVTSG